MVGIENGGPHWKQLKCIHITYMYRHIMEKIIKMLCSNNYNTKVKVIDLSVVKIHV